MFGTQKKEEIDSLAHTRWNCKYHIVFAPKLPVSVLVLQIRMSVKYHQRTFPFEISHKL